MTDNLVSRLTLLKKDASDADLVRLDEIEKESGFRTGRRFSLEGGTPTRSPWTW